MGAKGAATFQLQLRIPLSPPPAMSVSNISIYTIPAAFLVNMLPHVLRLTTIGLLVSPTLPTLPLPPASSTSPTELTMGQKWDNTAPRTNLETAAAKGMNKSVHAKLLRATGAHLNGLEMMPLFFSAVVSLRFPLARWGLVTSPVARQRDVTSPLACQRLRYSQLTDAQIAGNFAGLPAEFLNKSSVA